jgi:hypothetical protein
LAVSVVGAGLALLALGSPGGSEAEPAKLIQFGWDEPSTGFLRRQVRAMERMPFDGVVLNARYGDATGREAVLEWTGFGARRIPWEALRPALEDLEATDFRRFTHNFLRFNVTPGDVDWTEDFSSVLHNARMTARLVRLGGLRGVLLDVESYQRPVFAYSEQKYRGSRSCGEYGGWVRRRGRELMRALQSEAPGLTLFLTFGYGLAGEPSGRCQRPYGLLGPFLDGLFEAARGETRIVDGFEFSYPFRTPDSFERGYASMWVEGRRWSAVPRAYSARLLAGFGLWMDCDWRARGWSTARLESNHFTPAGLETALTAALRRTDRYVWLYSEQPRWWSGERLPGEYVRAVSRARLAAGLEL